MNIKRRNSDNFWNMGFDEIFEAFTEEFNQMKNNFNSKISENGPITFGYSMRIGPDTDYKPEVRQWGNLDNYIPSQGLPSFEWPFQKNLKPQIQSVSMSDYFVDIIEDDDSFKIIVEIPGFTKENLTIEISEDGQELILLGKTDTREVNQVVKLPSKIKPEFTKSTMINGILEIRSKKQKTTEKRHKLRID
ncbi:MAG: Hsp20/alpha crystallin family protein [Candidatus Heimdallarchaeota archaeon]|nr:Hsp20/alpha crystallin family protein [Candidatus Heimdallarchaeota archaeon]